MAKFPQTRMRRNRQSDWTRRLVREHNLCANDLIWPCFVIEGTQQRQAIESMPGVSRLSLDLLVESALKARDLGIPAIAVFPVIDSSLKDQDGSLSADPNNLICRAVARLKSEVPELGIICDVALDPFTSNGQDGIVRDGEVLNEATTDALCIQAQVQAEAGCDILAPSDMMDGRIGRIRKHLDSKGLENKQILSYAAKYASAFYGPFRDAVGSKSALGSADKRSYQQDPANGDEALREVALDIDEGADMIMVKPGMPYLDVIWRVKEAFRMPTLAYQVSGEYSMLMGASDRGWLDGEQVMMESLLAFKRAGADAILTYAAIDIAEVLAAKD